MIPVTATILTDTTVVLHQNSISKERSIVKHQLSATKCFIKSITVQTVVSVVLALNYKHKLNQPRLSFKNDQQQCRPK